MTALLIALLIAALIPDNDRLARRKLELEVALLERKLDRRRCPDCGAIACGDPYEGPHIGFSNSDRERACCRRYRRQQNG